MNASSDSKSDPAVLLLNGIEELLAQTRSMEHHLKHAQAAAEEPIKRLQEEVQRLDSIRSSNEEEIAALRHQVAAQERVLTGRHEAVTAVELALHGRIQSLQQDLAQRLREVAQGDSTIERLQCEAAASRARIAELEANMRSREFSGTMRRELEASLTAKDEQWQAAQASAHDNEKRFSVKVHELQIQLVERQLLVDRRAAELEDLRAAVTRLSAQVARQDAIQREPQTDVVDPAGINRTGRRTESAAMEKQEFVMKTDDHDEQAVQGVEEIGESSAPPATVEQSLRDEVNRLVGEAQEKNRILQDRNEELVWVKAELDRLQERLNQLESSASQSESALRDDSEQMRAEFQAQLALLQAELSQKEWTLEERQAEARGREQNLRQEMESLRQQLAESKAAIHHDARDFVFGEPQANHDHGQHFEGIGNSEPVPGDYTGSFAQQRRWNSGFSWKRRWRT